MEVTKSNFSALFPNVKDAIDECDFLAIDTELTGLSTQVTEHAFDTIAERYSKLRENCMKFIIIQYGLSTFKYHPKQNKYTHKDFNFYVFPRPHIRQAPDPKFMCQTSSLHFLASQGFDFNKVICDGIPYLSPSHEEKIRDVLANKHKSEQDALTKNGGKSNGQKVVDVPKEHEEFIAKVHEQVDSFISNDSETEMQLDPCSSYQRKLIYETVQQKYDSGIDMQSVMNAENKRVIAIVKTTDEEKHARLNMKQINDIDELDAAVGFRKVLDYISQSKKLVIGHNMLLDMMHTLEQFFHQIPEKLDDFKEMLHMTFPRIMDTKVLASSEKLRQYFDSTMLGEVVKTLQGKAFKVPSIEPCDGFKGYNLQSDRAHEAGFDAFLTGFSYIGLVSKLASLENSTAHCSDPDSRHLSPYLNRVFIMKQYDIGTLNICAPDPEPDRDNVFYVSFPQEWKTIDLVELFLPYGNIYVNWLDDVSALVALKNRENILNAKANLLNKPSRLYTVRSYSEYHKAMSKHMKKTTDAKRTQTCNLLQTNNTEFSDRKRRVSGSAESMELIPEADENEAEKADDSVSTSHESKSSSVNSTAGTSSSVSTSHESKSSSVKSKASTSSSDGPTSKRQKRYHEENDAEVTSTAKVFEEENNW